MKKYVKGTVYILLIFLTCGVSYYSIFNHYPSNIHAWAQADRYALSLCFLENGFDLFHPCTFHYNLQFPAKIPLVIEDGITAVDFPLNEYLIALIMKITGNTSPAIFRLYILIYSLIGLLYLFKLSYLFSKSTFYSYVVVCFALSSPVFFYYQISFLPSIPSLASLFIGLYYFFRYKNTSVNSNLFLALLFLTLAALYRLPFVIFLFSIILIQLRNFATTKKIVWQECFIYIFSISIVASYFCFNSFLRYKYGSIFLGGILPASSPSQFIEFLLTSMNTWGTHYFTIYHYLLLLFLVVCFLFSIKAPHNKPLYFSFILFVFLSALGVSFYSVLMIQQFQNHDYYFLDTFYPILLFVALVFISTINFKQKRQILIYRISLSLFIMGSFFSCFNTYTLRTSTGPWDDTETERMNFTNSSVFLDSVGISKSAKLLALGVHSSNLPFILMKRKGYRIINTSKEAITKALLLDYDYIVMQNDKIYNDIIWNYPDIINQLKKVFENEHLSIYTKRNTPINSSILEFLNFSNSTIKTTTTLSFDSIEAYTFIKNRGQLTDSIYHSKPHSECLSSAFGLTIELTEKELPSAKPSYGLYEGYFFSERKNTNALFVISIEDSAYKNTYYKSYPLNNYIQQQNSWSKVSIGFGLPALKKGDKASLYLYNPNAERLFYDDIQLLVR